MLLVCLLCTAGLTRFPNLAYRSLWADEAWRANHTLSEGWIPRSAVRVDPPLLYWTRKCSVSLLGKDEFAFRLPSVVLSLAGILCLYGATRIFTGNRSAGLLAAALLAAQQNHWWRSRDMNIYAGESFAMAALLVACALLQARPLANRRALLATGFAALAVGFGNAAAIAAVPLGLLALAWRQPRPQMPRALFLTVVPLLVMLAVWYCLWVRGVPAEVTNMVYAYFQGTDLPGLGIDLFERVHWVLLKSFDFLTNIYRRGSASINVLVGFSCVVTILGLLTRAPGPAFLKGMALLIVSVFAGLGFIGLYPWGAVRSVESLQVVFLALAGSSVLLLARMGRRCWIAYLSLFGLVWCAYASHQFYYAVMHPMLFQHARPVVQHLQERAGPGDQIFVHGRLSSSRGRVFWQWGSIPAFDYYWKGKAGVNILYMPEMRGANRVAERKSFLKTVLASNRRSWFFFSHDGWDGINEGQELETLLAEQGIKYSTYTSTGARAVLVEMANVPSQ